MNSKNLAGIIVLCAAHILTAADAPDLRVIIEEVTDKRTTGKFFAECEVKLKFIGDTLVDAAGVSEIRLTKAEDDTGRNLRKEEESSSFEARGVSEDTVSKKLSLRNPSRNAKTIRVIEGEVSVLKPTEANGGVAIVKNVLQQDGKWLESPGLTKAGVKVMFVTKETFDAKKKEADAARKAGEKLGEAFGEMFSGFFGGFSSSSPNDVRLIVQDKEKKMARLILTDGQGREVKTSGSMRSDTAHTYSLREAPPSDLQLKILLKTTEAEQRIPFKLENVVLP